MIRPTPNPRWFDLLHTAGIEKDFRWLTDMVGSSERIADFGCWTGSEPFALMWSLNASEVVVIEIEEQHVIEAQRFAETLQSMRPECLAQRNIRFVTADMSTAVHELPENYFDLAFCANVLYTMGDDIERVQRAVAEMARVVKPAGWVIAVEGKMGIEFEVMPCRPFGEDGPEFPVPIPLSDRPKDISALFATVGLVQAHSDNLNYWVYCYQKP
jgi:SAM-dependent methyltransferase